jgi:NIMA (never in mitosis gene a)-related kinase 2
LTPPPVFLASNGNGVKLGDFGLSRLLSPQSLATTITGTPLYMAPELFEERPYTYKVGGGLVR